MKFKLDINNIFYILIFIFIILLIVFKSISLHFKFKENFETQESANKKEASNTLEDNMDVFQDTMEEAMNDGISDMDEGRDDLESEMSSDKCVNVQKISWGAIVSKYTGRMINIEKVDIGQEPHDEAKSTLPSHDNKFRYLIKWKPLGNKPGGCITCNANGTYSTPMCDPSIENQLWHIVYIKNKEVFEKFLPNQKEYVNGRNLDNTEYPFYIVLSTKNNNRIRYVLNYEGGGLSIRPIANYDGIKWDISEEPIKQDLLPTQNNSKYSSLTPEHNITKQDTSLNKFFQKAGIENSDTSGNLKGKENGVNFNINLDHDLLQQLGLGLNTMGGSNNLLNDALGTSSNNNKLNNNKGLIENTDISKDADLLLTENELNARKIKKNNLDGRGNINNMIMDGANEEPCDNCGKVPPNYIKKDLVKSMCIGCNDIDNIST